MSPTLASVLQVSALVAALALVHRPLGDHMARVYAGTKHSRAERWIYRAVGADPDAGMRWPAYLRTVLAFSLAGVLLLYALQRLQDRLPLSLGFAPLSPDQAFNTAASFTSNTNWQSYAGESAMSHLTQTGGLAVQNFVSAAVGMSVAVALIRGFARARTGELGNFWADLVRGTVRILLPVSAAAAVLLVAAGAVQNFSDVQSVTTVTGRTQHLTGGAVASQEAIKDLGTNGGGFYNANSSHPYENPDGLSNLLEIFLLLLIPFSLPRTFGTMVGSVRQGYAVVAVFLAGLMVGRTPEYPGKRLGPREMKLADCYLLVTPALVLSRRAAVRDPFRGRPDGGRPVRGSRACRAS